MSNQDRPIIGRVSYLEARNVTLIVKKQFSSAWHIIYKGERFSSLKVGGFIGITHGYKIVVLKILKSYIKGNKKYELDSYEYFYDSQREIFTEVIGEIDEKGNFRLGNNYNIFLFDNVVPIKTEEVKKIYTRNNQGNSDYDFEFGIIKELNSNLTLNYQNFLLSHIGIFGVTGSGKTTTIKQLIKQANKKAEIKKNTEFIIIDTTGEFSDLESSEKNEVDKEDLENIKNSAISSEFLNLIFGNPYDSNVNDFANKLLNYINNSENIEQVSYEEIKDFQTSKAQWQKYLKSIYEKLEREILDKKIEKTIFLKILNILLNFISYEMKRIKDNDYITDYFYDHKTLLIFEELIQTYKHLEEFWNLKEKFILKNENKIVFNLANENWRMKQIITYLICLWQLKEKLETTDQTNKKSSHIIIDEFQNLFEGIENNTNDFINKISQLFKKIAREGRKYNLFLIVASQRPHQIESTIISQLKNVLLHRTTNVKDIKQVSENVYFFNDEVKNDLFFLEKGSFILISPDFYLPVLIENQENKDTQKEENTNKKETEKD
ncbi:ATP-binding protein [Mycoplasma procyoni]|uniref:ATP-binding protein n=1 Tax=Mycoplasma procyoni TaxID=568784 RepID=UPI00197B81E3|nr:ATP-binding protein [Mycoplasma procyoni]MBN3534377.1 ATP-binding protein [Mycoplasma procyoni]